MATDVNQQSTSAKLLNKFNAMLTALLGGTALMREGGKSYMPQWPNEEKEAYDARLASATLFPAYSRTVSVLSAKPFSEPAKLNDAAPARLKDEWWKDIDNEGSSFDQFSGRLLAEALGQGFAGILVDAPEKKEGTGPAGAVTREDEKKSGSRPYWCMLHAAQILGWRHEVANGVYKFTQLRYMEKVTEPDGEWGDACVDQVRVIEPKKWTTYRKAPDGKWVKHQDGTTELDYVPFVPVYGTFKGFMKSEPPLLDLAYMNVKHWQSQSDQDTLLHFARVPILAFVGGDEKTKVTIGGSTAIVVPLGGELKFVEHTGKAIDSGKVSLETLEGLMRQAGAELLVIRPGVTTATQIFSENEAGMCTLQRITLNLQASLNLALKYTLEIAGETGEAEVTLYKDFGVSNLAEANGEMLTKMNTQGIISKQTTFEEAQRRGIIDPERSWEDEQERMDEEGPALGSIPGEDDMERDEMGNVKLDPVTGLPMKKKLPVPPPPGTGAAPPFGGNGAGA